MVILAVVLATLGVLGSYPGNTPAALAASDVGYRDFSFAANAVNNPTGEKPQSKLWFNDGVWWASLFDRATEEYHIYRYDWSAHTWNDTGTLIDERNSSKADALWDGTHLYVVSAGASGTDRSHGARVLRYSYDQATKKYTLDQGFPVTITSAGLETIVLDKDTTGKLWVTYRWNNKIYVNRTLSNDQTWGTHFVLPVKGTSVSADDISAVVAFDNQVGVMWSNQVDSAMYFATHNDGDPDNVWQGSRTAIQGPNYADDHISLRSLQAADSSGRVFAAVKTSLNDLPNPNPNAPLNLLLARDRDGNWTNHVFGRVGDNHTRPTLMLDEEHRDLYMFATAPCCTGGAVYYKKASLNNVSFSPGLGEPFIQSSTDLSINDATSTKQNLSSATGLVVMASSGTVVAGTTGSGYYWHNAVNLGGVVDNIPPETGIDSGPSGTVDGSSATFVFSSTEPDSAFECALDGATFNSCASPQDYAGLSDGPHTFRVRATDAAGNTDPTPAELSWTVGSTTLEAPAIASPADNSYNNTGNITVSGTAEPGNTVELFDGAASVGVVTTNASGDWSKELGGVTEGSHTYTAKTTDAAGNTSAASNGRTIIVDTTPPETAIDSGPSGTSNSASATFAFSSTEPNSRFECALDGASFNSCTSPKDYANLSAGSHAFEVRATDVAGNTDPTPASRTWTVGTPPAPGCTITGTANAETLTGTSADDVICAGGGNDTVNGLGGNDTLKGEAGGDTLLGGVGDDTLDGGLGTDTASYSASPTAVTASLATNSATGEGSDTLLGVENLIGSSSADTLTGSDAINRLAGGDGDDTERGGLGNDTVQGNGGADTLDGGDGDDTVNSKDGVNGNDSLDGGAGTDTQVSDATEKSVVGFP
jgi:Ca2+-binding RTX toxin-like protein